MGVVDPYEDALATLTEKKKPAGKNALVEGAKGFAVGAGKAVVSPFTEAARVAGEMFPEVPAALGMTPPRSRIAPVPSHAPAGTVAYEQAPPEPTTGRALAGEAALGLASWIPAPTPFGPIFPVQLGRSLLEGAQAGAPVQGPQGPMPPPSSIVGERLGGAAVGTAFGAPGLVGAGLGRFRQTGRPIEPLPQEGAGKLVPADYDIVQDGPRGLLGPGPGEPAPAPQGALGTGPMPPQRPMLPQGHRGLTAEKVEPGFTPMRSTYRVWIGAKPQVSGPGGKAAKPEFRQYKDFTAFSREDAIQKAQDALGGQKAAVLEFKADEVKGSGQALSVAESRATAEGRIEPSITRPERHAEKAVGAIRGKLQRDEALQAQKLVAGRPEKPIALPATSAATRPATKPGKAVAPEEKATPEFPLRAKPEPKEPPPSAVEAVAAVEEKPIGGKSKVVREPTAEEAETMAPGEAREAPTGEKVVRVTAETERRLTERRGAGGGATSFGEERGPEAIERRVAEKPGRRAEDRAVLAEAAGEGRRRLVEIKSAKTHAALTGIYRKHHNREPSPGISTKALREELVREAASLVKGATQAGKLAPKVGAAAEAAKPGAEEPLRGFTESQRERASEIAGLSDDEIVALGKKHNFIGKRTKSQPHRLTEEAARYGIQSPAGRKIAAHNIAKIEERDAPTVSYMHGKKPEATPEGGATLYSGLHPEAFKPILEKAGQKAKQLRDWLLIPESERATYKPGESLRDVMMRGELPGRLDRLRRWIAQSHTAFTKAMILNYETRRFPYFHEQIDQFRVDGARVAEKTTKLVADVVHPIIYRTDPVTGAMKRRPAAESFVLARKLNWVLTITDLWGRAKEGKLTPAHGFPMFANLNHAEVVSVLKGEMDAAMNSAPPAVKAAHKNWIALMEDTGRELKRRGALQTPRDWTYAPNIFRGETWAEFARSQRGALRPGEPTRSYVKRALGHMRKHDTNMIRAGVDHLHSVMMDNLSSDFAHSVGQAWDYSAKVFKQAEAAAKKRGVSIEQFMEQTPLSKFLVEGEGGVRSSLVPYRVGRARHLWKPESDIEYAMQKTLLEDPDFGLTFENLSQIKQYAKEAEGAKNVYLIPEAIAEDLRRFREPLSSFDQMARSLGVGINTWKAATLAAVYAAYKTGNMIGDAANIATRTPSTIPLLNGLKIIVGKTPKALIDIAKAYKTGEPSPSLLKTDVVGGRQNVRAIAEIGDLRAHKDLSVFYEPEAKGLAIPATAFFKAMQAGLADFMVVDAVLEGAMRHASIEYLMEKGFPAKRAEQFTSHIVGDYRSVDRFTAAARRNWAFPFMVWMRQMVPGYVRWLTGAKLGKHFEGPGGGAFAPPNVPRPPIEPPKGTDPALWKMAQSGSFSKATQRTLLTLAALQALWWYWNSVVNQDLDEKVPDTIKLKHTYLINPMMKTADGRPALLLDVQMPWDAAAGFFGVGNIPERIARMTKAADSGKPGEVSKVVMDQINETLAGPPEGIAAQSGPPFRVMSNLFEYSQRKYFEQLKPPEKQKLDKIRADTAKKIVKNVVPFSRMVPGIGPVKREDLEGLPEYMPYILKGTPWGFVVVPIAKKGKKTLKPIGAGLGSGLKPVGSQ